MTNDRVSELINIAHSIARRAIEDEANEWMTLEEQVYVEEWEENDVVRDEELGVVRMVLFNIAEEL